MRADNLTLLTDLYELTMMQGYFKNPSDQVVVFDMFYRTNPWNVYLLPGSPILPRDTRRGDYRRRSIQ